MADPATGPAEVTDAPAEDRFEIRVDGALAGFVTYRRRPGALALIHTEIDPAFAGRGLGGALIRGTLDAARAQGLAILPFCPFARDWIAAHPDHLDLVPADRRTEFALPADG